MLNDKTRTMTSKDGNKWTDSTYRTWLRDVGNGGDRSSLVRTVSILEDRDGEHYISGDICLSDCSSSVNYDLYIDGPKAAKRQLDFIGKLRDELLIMELELYHAAKRFGWTQTEDE